MKKQSDKKPSLDVLRKREGLTSSSPRSSRSENEKALDKLEKQGKDGKKKRRFSVFQKVAMGVIGIFLLIGGFLGWKLFALGNAVVDSNSDRSLFDQLRLLVDSGDEKLDGEEDGRINILLLGKGSENHPGSDLTDSIMLASINVETNQVALLSFPRDLYVPLPDGGSNKINAAHAFAEQAEEGSGPAAISQVIEEVTGQDVHYYARIDFDGFQKIVDDLGGIDVPIEEGFYDYLHKVRFDEGIDHMDGSRALKYARGRYIQPAYLGGDFERARKQQKVMLALRDKILSTGTILNIDTISNLLESLGETIKTDMEVWEMKRMYDLVGDVDTDSIVTQVVDGGPDGLVVGDSVILGGVRASIQVPRAGIGDFSEIQELAANIFNPDYVPEDATVELQNGSGVAGLATSTADEITPEVVEIANAARSDFATTIIYDYSEGANPNTLKDLEEFFGVSASPLPSASVAEQVRQSQADFVVIIGSDYADKQ